MKVLVCGGRGYSSWETVAWMLDRIHRQLPIDCVIHGGATGTDSLAARWAAERDIAAVACPADWERHGKAAGPIRNAEMLHLNPALVVAFPGGSGTQDMIAKARAAGIEVRRIG